jgi:hypothetical protein
MKNRWKMPIWLWMGDGGRWGGQQCWELVSPSFLDPVRRWDMVFLTWMKKYN